MTFIAQQALEDAIYVRERLAKHPEGTEWRVLWTAGVSLLRTTAYALQNRDVPEENLPERKAYADSWDRWKIKSPENTIWHEFINHERHKLLKEYRSAVAESQVTSMAPGMNIVVSNDPREIPIRIDEGKPVKGIQVRHMIVTGYYKDRDAIEIFDEAIRWLKTEIGKIESDIHQIQTNN